jgi:formylglycine-generating enzyme required for sulfatase activity
MSNGTQIHNEICNRFRDENYSKEFIEEYTKEGCKKIYKIILEDIISNNNILIGFCDVVINYEDNGGRQQKALIEVKSSAAVINKDPQEVLRQIKKYRFYNKKITKSFLVYTSEETDEGVKDLGLFSDEDIIVIDVDNIYISKVNYYYYQDGRGNCQSDRIEDIIEPEEPRELTIEMWAEFLDTIAKNESQEAPPQAVDIWTEPVTGMEFVWVPGGSFMMGTDYGSEMFGEILTVHEVRLDGFWIGRYPVTQGQWQKIMGDNPSEFKSGDDFPVEMVSWDDVQQFISHLNRQSGKLFALPSEAQWEYAARSGGKNETYAGGEDVDAVAWYAENSGGTTHQVGTKAPNGLGIYDMTGNVAEWCADAFESDAYSKHVIDNPVIGANNETSTRVCRGGTWREFTYSLGAAYRCHGFIPDLRRNDLGFRLSLSQVRPE